MIRPEKIDNHARRKVYFFYTVLFLIAAVIFSMPFIRAGKSFVYAKDGLYQHYNAFVYLGTYIREIIRNLFTTHKLEIPMWEFGLGYGADIVTTLSYYVIGDPIALVSVLTPIKYADTVYSLSILLRLYLSGIAFCMYARKMKCDDLAAICAALGYAFCGFGIFMSIRNSYFASPMIYLPLLLLAEEKILRKERAIPFALMVFLTCISNFYFFYQIVLIVVLYTVIRCMAVYKGEETIRSMICVCAKLAVLGLIGIAMASVIFFPSAMAFLSSHRLSSDYQYDLLYPLSYYKALLGSYIAEQNLGYDAHIGITPVLMLGVVALFIKGKEHRWLKWMLSVLTVFLLLPFCGHLFNGMGYVCNRWSYAYAFFIAFAFACMFPKIRQFGQREKMILGGVTGIYTVLCIAFWESRNEAVLVSCGILWVGLLVILNIDNLEEWLREYTRYFAEMIVRMLIFGLILLGIWSNSSYIYSSQGSWKATGSHDANGSYEDITEISSVTEELIGMDDSFYRVDIHEGDFKDGGNSEGRNALISKHQSTTSMYWSILSPYIISYLTENSAYGGANYEFRNLQSRALLMPFAAVSYYVHAGDGEYVDIPDVPYGFAYLGKGVSGKGNVYTVYQSNQTLPLGYTYNAYITASEYEAMSVEERQEATLYGIVLEDTVCEDIALEHSIPQYMHENLNYNLVGDENIEINEGNINVKKNNAQITLQFECPADRELYLKLNLSEFLPKKSSDFLTQEEWESYSKLKQESTRLSDRSWVAPSRTWLEAGCNDRTAGLQCFPVYDHVYDGRTDYFFNLGYSHEARDTITLSFSEPGIYTYGGIDVIAQPMDMLEECITALQENTLEQVEISNNRISGVITADQTKVLCLSVPYSSGWSILVDGQQAELLQANVMYMGVVIPEGTHSVELCYETPYLKMGFVMTIIGFILFVIIALVDGRSEKATRIVE